MKIDPVVRKALVTSFIFTLWLRFVLFLIGYILLILVKPLPLNSNNMDFVELVPSNNIPFYQFVQPTMRFDALWYKDVSLHYYSDNSKTAAFFPLYPTVIHFFGLITKLPYEIIAFFANTVLFFLFLFLLYLISYREFGEDAAFSTVAIYTFFPTSFFLLSPYAEILLLTLLLTSIFLAEKKKFFLSAIFGALAAATKPFVVVFVIPLLYLFWKTNGKKLITRHFFFLSFIPLAYVGVILFQDHSTGILFSTFASQTRWGIHYSFPWDLPGIVVRFFLTQGYNLAHHINLIAAIAFGWVLILSWKVLRGDLWILSCIFYFVFISSSTKYNVIPFFSFSRYVLILFPLFLFVASRKVHRLLKVLFASISIVFLILYFTLYSLGFFVA